MTTQDVITPPRPVTSHATATRSEAPPRSVIRAMAISMVATLMVMLDTTVVNVSLSATTARFGSMGSVQWVLTSYLLALCATMTASDWVIDRLGPRLTFIASMTMFLIGSVMCALSDSVWQLVTGRTISGAGAGILVPTASVLLIRGIPREQLGRVQALNGSVQLIAPLIGPTVGGLLVDRCGGWPAIYWANVPVALVLLIEAVRVDPDEPHTAKRRLDALGLVCGSTAIVLTVLGVSLFGRTSRNTTFLLTIGALAVLAWAFFITHIRRATNPLLDVSLYQNPVYSWSSFNVAVLGFGLYAPMVVMPLYLEATRHLTAVHTGLVMSVAGVGVIMAGILCTKIMGRIGGGLTMTVGITLSIIATLPLVRLTNHTSYILLAVCLALRGAGISLTIVPAMTRAFESIKRTAMADASAQLNLLQRIGGTIATAVIIAVIHHEAMLTRGLSPTVFSHANVWILTATAVTLLPAFALAKAERQQQDL